MLMLSRILISFVTLVTLIGSNIADWNDTHIFSELPLMCLSLVWLPGGQVDRSRTAALIQGCCSRHLSL
jgi:hypothetical protein